MLGIAKGMLEKEVAQIEADKIAYMATNCPEQSMPSSLQELQVKKKKHSHCKGGANTIVCSTIDTKPPETEDGS